MFSALYSTMYRKFMLAVVERFSVVPQPGVGSRQSRVYAQAILVFAFRKGLKL